MANAQLSITNPELDLHQSGVVVFRGTGPAGATLDFAFAARQHAQRTVNRSGVWEIKMRVPTGQRRIEATATFADGTIETVRRNVEFLDSTSIATLSSPDSLSAAADLAQPPIVSHARLGIGVTDPVWWELRYETLRHIMVPSLVNAHVPGHRLLLGIDSAISQDVLEKLKLIIEDCGAGEFADLVFIDSVWSYPAAVENYLRLHFGNVPVIMHGIDDDDAVSGDFFRLAREKVAAEDPNNVQLHTFPFGLMYNIELHQVQLGVFPWHSMNQFTYGYPDTIHILRAHSHNRIQFEGERRGWVVRVHEDVHLGYVYTHHKQSDSGYVKRLETMRLNDQSFPLGTDQAAYFGLHHEELLDLSHRISAMPSVTGRTWLVSTQFQDAERDLLKASNSIKQLRLNATREIVEREAEAVPAPTAAVEGSDASDPGLVRFVGEYLPEHFVRISVDGTDRASLFINKNGRWNYPIRLEPGQHVVELVGVSPRAATSPATSTEFTVDAAADQR
ncbi:glycosyltransferase [Brachybacterium sp. UNK5269]|uniref:glycosyltransferase n=1 Tax=Brachybacterium sp. UNK5269 TaxID=3408576 RepID=UPI003BAEBF1D